MPDSDLIGFTCWVKNTPREDALDQFVGRWGDVEDPRSGNAALHDFHELLMIALCAVLSGGQSAVDSKRCGDGMADFA